MNTYLLKLLNNPFYYTFFIINKIFCILLYPIRLILFKKIYPSTYISFNSSIINHKNIQLHQHTIINYNVILWPTKLYIGKFSQINSGTAIYGNVSIGNNVMIAPNCMLAGGNHNFSNINIPMRFQGSNEKGIIINDDVWIGANSVVLDGVTIGKGTIVGAGSVVTKNLESYSIYFGNPAKFIKKRID